MKSVRFKQIRLIWRLFKDPRVPAWLKALVLLIPLIYILLPIDLSPDATPILGQIDDIILALLALKVFLELSPRRVVEEQRRQIESISVPYRVLGKEEEEG